MRVFAISDIHLDYEENVKWMLNLSKFDYQDDVLILAGDISDIPDLLQLCFESLAARFNKVLYVPGNHDLWVIRNNIETSLEKYILLEMLTSDAGVSMEPFHSGTLSIVPLQSWYDFSFGQPGEELKKIWMDFKACVWPENFDITDHFLRQNIPLLELKNETVITFSHFLPRIDVMPSYIPASKRTLYPVLGTHLLERQLRQLKPKLHVYGHSHVNRRVSIDGVCYINNAFGYPAETRITAKQLLCIFDN